MFFGFGGIIDDYIFEALNALSATGRGGDKGMVFLVHLVAINDVV